MDARGNVVALHRRGIRGLFSAVRDGIEISNGRLVLTMDADFSHPPEMISKMLKHAESNDIVSGSRFVKGGKMEGSFVSVNGARMLNKMCQLIIGLDVKDLGGNFHLFKKTDFEKIDFWYESEFGEFSFELFHRAKKLGLSVKEVPFVYKKRAGGNSKMGSFMGHIKHSRTYLKRALELRFEK